MRLLRVVVGLNLVLPFGMGMALAQKLPVSGTLVEDVRKFVETPAGELSAAFHRRSIFGEGRATIFAHRSHMGGEGSCGAYGIQW